MINYQYIKNKKSKFKKNISVKNLLKKKLFILLIRYEKNLYICKIK